LVTSDEASVEAMSRNSREGRQAGKTARFYEVVSVYRFWWPHGGQLTCQLHGAVDVDVDVDADWFCMYHIYSMMLYKYRVRSVVHVRDGRSDKCVTAETVGVNLIKIRSDFGPSFDPASASHLIASMTSVNIVLDLMQSIPTTLRHTSFFPVNLEANSPVSGAHLLQLAFSTSSSR
jgi:hypothetical protein